MFLKDKKTKHDVAIEVSDYSICDDKFQTQEDYTRHVQDHLGRGSKKYNGKLSTSCG